MSETSSAPFIPNIRLYQDWLRERHGLVFDNYDALWRWSTTELDAFWQSIWDYFELQSPTRHSAVLARNVMPGAVWFPGAQVNYARQVLRHADAAHAAGMPAIVSLDEKALAASVRSAGPPQASTAPLGGSALHEVKSVGAMPRELSWPELRRQVASLALHLKAQGVVPGDRVAAYLPNIPEAMVAFLATASLGAIWSICAPDMGSHAVLDRFRQIAPKVLIACDGVRYGGRDMDRTAVVGELRAALPSLQHVIIYNSSFASNSIADCARLSVLTDRNDAEVMAFEPLWLPFDHPLWIVYSSGTTGLPKPIVHGHGGTLIVGLALNVLHNDVGCSYAANSLGERFHWYSSTGWVMWNVQLSGLLGGTTCVIYDGNPGGSKEQPDWGTLWRFAADTGVTFFGAGAAFYASCMKAGVDLSQCGDLAAIRALGTTGSPLSPEAQDWGTGQFRRVAALGAGSDSRANGRRAGPPQASSAPSPDERGSVVREATSVGAGIWWCNISGGTDFCGAFIGGNRELPQQAGVMQCRLLGCAVEAWNDAGLPVLGEVGELVCAQPIPSMPLYFWGDQNNARYLASYFEMYPAGHGRKPGGGDLDAEAGAVWRHGDWLRIGTKGQGAADDNQGCVIFGRSDATINRHGLRMGTSELYSAIEALPEVLDSLVVDLEYLGRESYMPLFVVLREGQALDAAMKARINAAVRTALSPRFVPDDIFQVAQVPRTLSGKKQELPVKKLLLGQPLEKVVNRDAMSNPDCLDWYVAFARQRAG